MVEPVSIKAMLVLMGFASEAQGRMYDVTHQGTYSIEEFFQLNEESVKTL